MTKFTKLLAASILGSAMLSACQPASETKTPVQDVAKKVTKKAQSTDWKYVGEYGAANWGTMSDKFSTCATGKLQSPFNITADISADLPALGLNYNAVPMKVINNGHTIQADQAGGGQLVVDGTTYNLLQFHFHAGSEYTIDGKSYPLEVHLVHASDAGALAVVGVMFEKGAANAELGKIWANMPAKKGENAVAGQTINVNKLLPANKQYYRFMGSLTTPPCSEGVNWHMMSTPITASQAQLDAFTAIYPMNARPLQDENNRLVVLGR
ncbi:MAG: carbonic anhydrase family protein [Robiginitomaculum sp.]|nr:carbonic anhydrase family protein [Robiginitomaculum sp.]